jgi:hypothetical protein
LKLNRVYHRFRSSKRDQEEEGKQIAYFDADLVDYEGLIFQIDLEKKKNSPKKKEKTQIVKTQSMGIQI